MVSDVTAALELKHNTKEYHGIPAVKDVGFTLERGEIHALLGENGAGKSTLTKMMAGVVKPTSGEILLDGEVVTFANPAAALASGIAMVFQETSLVPTLTVAQNLYLGTEKFLNRLRGIYISAQQFFQSLNFPVDPTALARLIHEFAFADDAGRWYAGGRGVSFTAGWSGLVERAGG